LFVITARSFVIPTVVSILLEPIYNENY
jgi:hypothetical protein